ncbi:MAG: hypothetical protein QOI66_1897 [Myxococcales bacterium]|jgi:hypothetical protein|nr:hypothetical protein [Myxococcales bacterium]
MNPAVAFIPKFFIICSVILIISGAAQVLVRPRREGETMMERLVNRSTITAVVTIGFGIFGLLVGLGVIPMVRFPLG